MKNPFRGCATWAKGQVEQTKSQKSRSRRLAAACNNCVGCPLFLESKQKLCNTAEKPTMLNRTDSITRLSKSGFRIWPSTIKMGNLSINISDSPRVTVLPENGRQCNNRACHDTSSLLNERNWATLINVYVKDSTENIPTTITGLLSSLPTLATLSICSIIAGVHW